jgi:DNA primase
MAWAKANTLYPIDSVSGCQSSLWLCQRSFQVAFDVASFLDDNGIVYDWYDETNVTLDCPYCGKGKRHFCISVEKPVFHCFKCGEKGDWVRVVAELLGVPINEAYGLVHGALDFTVSKPVFEKPLEEVKLPADTGWIRGAKSYLLARGIDDWMIDRYKLYFTLIPPYSHRIIIPIFYQKKVVSFQARTILDDAPLRYKNPPGVNTRDFLYGYDDMDSDSPVTIVEGPFDRMILSSQGINTVAIFGKELTDSQLRMLDGVKDIRIMFDSDATDKAVELYYALDSYFDSILIVPLVEGDPADQKEQSAETNNKFEILKKMVGAVKNKLDRRYRLGIG